MNLKTLYALFAAAAISLVAAIWINTANEPISEGSEKQQTLLPGFGEQVNSIDLVTVTGAGDKVAVTLKRNGAGWQVSEKAGYPADVSKVRELLLKLVDADVIETKTANPKRYADLGVDDVTGKDAKGLLLTLGGAKQPVKVIVGLSNNKGGGGTFVRRDGEAQSLLVKGALAVEKDPAAWVQHDLIDIESARIKQVTLVGIDGKTLRAYKEQSVDSSFKIADVPKGRELATDFVANSLGTGLTSLRADDVATAKDAPVPDKVYKAAYLGFGGLVVDVVAWEANGKGLVQLSASNDAAQLDADIAAEQGKAKAAYETAVAAAKLKVVEAKGDDAAIAKAESEVVKPPSLVDAAKDRAQREAAAAKVVEDLNKTLKGWTFTVPQYAFGNFKKSMEDMLKPLPSKPVAPVKAETGKSPSASVVPAKPAGPTSAH